MIWCEPSRRVIWSACRSESVGGVGEERTDADRRAVRIWIPFETDRDSGFWHQHEDASGRVLDFEGRVHHRDGSVSVLTGATHAFEYHPGTRRLAGGGVTLPFEDGRKVD